MSEKEAKRIIEKICKEQGWAFWYDNEGKLCIDVEGSLDLGD